MGRLTIMDPDQVEMSNLHRQTLYRAADIGEPKAVAAAARATALNPDGQATAIVDRLDPANAPGLIATADLVVDAADSFAVTYTLSDLCLAAGKPLVSASIIGRAVFAGRSPVIARCFPICPRRSTVVPVPGCWGQRWRRSAQSKHRWRCQCWSGWSHRLWAGL